jgi:hypothetical protein
MQVLEVRSREDARQFLEIPKKLYRNDPCWVCPLDNEVGSIFDPSDNILFKNGEAIRWILIDGNGQPIGRVAAFINRNKAFAGPVPVGGMGFFECIHSREAAFLLFDACRKWLAERGMQAMDGPVNFGENLTYWGLLVDGFSLPVYGMPYNFPYYRELFESYGFKTYFEQYSYEADLSKPLPERQVKFSQHLKEKFQAEHFSFKNKEKYLNDIVTIYNKVWEDFHEDYTPLAYSEIEKMMKKAKAIINEEFIWFIYDQGKPVALVVVFPDVNQILKKLGNGRLGFLNILKFLWYKNTGTITRARQLLTAVIPEYQRSGVTGVLFITMVDALKRNRIKVLDMSWVGDYNVTVNKIYRLWNLPVAKTHITYRCMFDPAMEVTRFTNAETEKTRRLTKNE